MVEVRVRAAMAAAALAEDTVANMVAVGSKAVVVSSPQVGLVGGAAERAAAAAAEAKAAEAKTAEAKAAEAKAKAARAKAAEAALTESDEAMTEVNDAMVPCPTDEPSVRKEVTAAEAAVETTQTLVQGAARKETQTAARAWAPGYSEAAMNRMMR